MGGGGGGGDLVVNDMLVVPKYARVFGDISQNKGLF